MVKLLKKIYLFLNRQQNSIFSAASIIMVTVALSRFLGLWRDRLLAARFAPGDLGVYYAAFRIPNMIFELLVMGALSTAFIPVFTAYLDTKGKEESYKMASYVINIGLMIFIFLSIPLIIFTKQLCFLLAPGFNQNQLELMVTFTRIMIIAQVFPLIIGNFFSGILQSFRNFIIPAIAPVIYNLGIIFGIIFLSPLCGLYAPVYGVVIGAFLFALVQMPPVFSLGYRHILGLSFSNKGTREVGKLMLPRTLGLAVSQIDSTIDLALSTLLGASAVTVFNFAQHLQQVPVGLFGASIAQALLPTLSSLSAKNNNNEFKKVFSSAFQQILFLVIPLSVILIVLRIPIVRLVFGSSTLFDWNSTVATGKTLAFFSFSLFAQSLVHLLARSFYALHDSKTPVVAGAISVFTNTLLSLLFVLYFKFDVWSLGLSASIASILNMLLLLLFLDRKVGCFDRMTLLLPAFKILLSGMVTAVALYIPIKLLDQLVFDTTKTINLLILFSISTFMGLVVYFFLAWFMEVPQVEIVFKLLRRAKFFHKGLFIDNTQEVENIQETKI